jgi:hypothetical protein
MQRDISYIMKENGNANICFRTLLASQWLSSGQNPERSDATEDDSSATAGIKIKTKNTKP